MANTDLLLGPVLGYEWDDAAQQPYYTVIVRAAKGAAPVWVVDGQQVPMQELRALHDGSSVWRGEAVLQPFEGDKGRWVDYAIQRGKTALGNACGDSAWRFHLPGKPAPDQQPRIAFCSCNGFTDYKAMNGRAPLLLWQRMLEMHAKDPFSLLVMGGDQLYCDDLAHQEGGFAKLWAWLSPKDRVKAKPTDAQFLAGYFDHYLLGWVRRVDGDKALPHTAMVRMMASVPSIMMWDDHDIFDGWGSYQSDQSMPYYKEAFVAARAAFEVYQLRGAACNRSLLDRRQAGPRHYSLGLRFGPYHVLALDNRTQRSADQIMDKNHWEQVIGWLQRTSAGLPAGAHSLLVVAPIPVVYRRFQDWISALPGEHSGEDDLRDHWNHKNHQGERNRLVSHLFGALQFDPAGTDYAGTDKRADVGFSRITLLSGDVHVGALGFLERTDTKAEIAQVISSAIIHPEPGPVAWAGLQAISSDDDFHIQGQAVVAKMAPPVGTGPGDGKYLRCRNFVWLRLGNDAKLWVNWECEDLQGGRPARTEFGLR